MASRIRYTSHVIDLSPPSPTSISYRIMILLTTCEVVKRNNYTWAQRFKYKHQCTNNPVRKMDLNKMAAEPEITKLINNDMWLVQNANTKQTFTLIWFFLLNNQQMCVKWRLSLRFLASSDYMYIFDKPITKYTKEIMFVLWLSLLVALSLPSEQWPSFLSLLPSVLSTL